MLGQLYISMSYSGIVRVDQLPGHGQVCTQDSGKYVVMSQIRTSPELQHDQLQSDNVWFVGNIIEGTWMSRNLLTIY